MRQQIVISGLGGQGVLTLTRILAQAADTAGHDVLTAETHGMAQRGGAVVSTVKAGSFHGPLIGTGQADVGLFLVAGNLVVHGHLLRPGGAVFLNAASGPDGQTVDAGALATGAGAPRSANLALLGFAAGRGGLFSGPAEFEAAIRACTPSKFLEQNLRAFEAGVRAGQAPRIAITEAGGVEGR